MPEITKKQLEENHKLMECTAITDSVITNQATINIGTIGHVAHGKSTVVHSITGKSTQKFASEKIRNITIKLGYANAKIYKCPICPEPQCYKSFGSSKKDAEAICKECHSLMLLKRHVSFVDCPGHDVLMATMLNGAAVMDACLLLVAANEPCPQPQTCEHLAAIEIMQMKYLIILQNKIDLVKSKEDALNQKKSIKQFAKYSIAENSPIIPISAQSGLNTDYVLEHIVKTIPVPKRILNVPPRMIVIRSFDVNKPGTFVEDLKGGVLGGCILEGVLKVGDEIEIRPGRKIMDRETGKCIRCQPIKTRVSKLKVEETNDLQYAVPGGLIAIGTLVDPSLTKSDSLSGHVIGYPGRMPDVYITVDINYYLLNRIIGVKNENNEVNYNKIEKLKKGEILQLNIGSTSVSGDVKKVKDTENQAKIELRDPVCANLGEKIAISRKIQTSWRLIGWAKLTKGYEIMIE